MHAHPIDPSDEERHAPGSEQFWNESYYFDFHRDDGSLGGYVRIGIYPQLGATWYWACVIGAERPLVMVKDHAAPLPTAPSIDIITPAYTATHRCEVPNQRFRVGLEAQASVFEEPGHAYDSASASQTSVEFDLLWETDGPGGYRYRELSRYEIPCRVSGEIRVGDESIDFSGYGQRDHSWGERDWWNRGWCWNSGRLEDGTRFHCVVPRTLSGIQIPFYPGYVQSPDEVLTPIQTSSAEEELGEYGFPIKGRLDVGDLSLEIHPAHFAPVRLVAPDGRVSHFARALAEYRSSDGRSGWGWIEWNQPEVPDSA